MFPIILLKYITGNEIIRKKVMNIFKVLPL